MEKVTRASEDGGSSYGNVHQMAVLKPKTVAQDLGNLDKELRLEGSLGD